MPPTNGAGPHHSEDTDGGNSIIVEWTAELLPHDSPEFIERANRGGRTGKPADSRIGVVPPDSTIRS